LHHPHSDLPSATRIWGTPTGLASRQRALALPLHTTSAVRSQLAANFTSSASLGKRDFKDLKDGKIEENLNGLVFLGKS